MSETALAGAEAPNEGAGASAPRPLFGGVRLGYRTGLVLIALLTVALRVRFLFTPIAVDEGGYVAIARAWRHGDVLYKDLFLDRPQGLVLVYRAWDMLSGGNTAQLRVIAIVFAIIAAVAIAETVRMLRDRSAGLVAGTMAAVLLALPSVEGHTANGELLAGTGSAVAIAFGCSVLVGHRTPRWMFAAGVMAGVAISMKQSGVDGLAALTAWLLLAALFRWTPRRAAIRLLAILWAGVAAVLALLALHGAITGWSSYWFAMWGYRSTQLSVFVGANWENFWHSASVALPMLLPLLYVLGAAVIRVVVKGRVRAVRPVVLILPLWMLTATMAFLSGGQFFRHYWVTLLFPLAAIGGYVVGGIRTGWLRVCTAAVLLLPAFLSWERVVLLPRLEVARTVEDYGARQVERITEALGPRLQPDDVVYVFCARADQYASLDKDPPYPYLWLHTVRHRAGALDELREMLAASDRPDYLIMYQPRCDESGGLDAVVAEHYDWDSVVGGILIMRAKDTAP